MVTIYINCICFANQYFSNLTLNKISLQIFFLNDMKKIIHTKAAPEPIGPYSQAVLVDNVLYVSGQIPIDPASKNIASNDIEKQTKQVMENIQAILKAAGTNMRYVVKSSLFIKNMTQFEVINNIYGSYFTGPPPARETIEVSRLPRDVDIEISVIAVLPESRITQ
jgi:2-iminobutanoate/2-iminopropanoate deaminase